MPPRREVVDPPLAERPKRGLLTISPQPPDPGQAHLARHRKPMAGGSPDAIAMPRHVTFPREPRRSVSRAAAESAFTIPAAYTRREFYPSQDRNLTIQRNIPPQNRTRRTRRGVGALRTFGTIDLSSGTGNAVQRLYGGNAGILLKYPQRKRRRGDIGTGSVFRKI